MPDLSTPYGGGPSDVGVNAAASTGIVLTNHASTHTKGTWVELIAATAHETTWVLVTLIDTSAQTAYAVDIGIGAGSAEQVLIPNLLQFYPVSTQPIPRVYVMPLAIPKGSRISARSQGATGAATITVGIQCFSGPITAQHGLRRVETAGVDVVTGSATGATLLSDPGATINTDSTWQQQIAATTVAWRWMCVYAHNVDTQAIGISAYLVDIGLGAAAAETAIVNDLWFLSHTGTDNPVPGTYCFPCSIAAGSRIAIRSRSSQTQSGDRRLSIALYGVG